MNKTLPTFLLDYNTDTESGGGLTGKKFNKQTLREKSNNIEIRDLKKKIVQPGRQTKIEIAGPTYSLPRLAMSGNSS